MATAAAPGMPSAGIARLEPGLRIRVLALFQLIIRFMTHLQQFDNLLTH
jgi:hypothetical protein